MDYTAKAIEALGKALSDRDITISTLRWECDSLRKRVAELEAPPTTTIETNITTTIKQEGTV